MPTNQTKWLTARVDDDAWAALAEIQKHLPNASKREILESGLYCLLTILQVHAAEKLVDDVRTEKRRVYMREVLGVEERV